MTKYMKNGPEEVDMQIRQYTINIAKAAYMIYLIILDIFSLLDGINNKILGINRNMDM